MTSALKQTEPQSKESHLQTLISQMEGFRQKFILATKEYTSDWYEEVANNFFQLGKDVTAKMSKEERFAFIDKVKELQASSSEKIDNILGDKSLWWHLDTNSSTDNDRYKSIEKFMPESFNYLLGELGVVLVEYGYIERSKWGEQNFFAEQKGDGGYKYKFGGLYFPSDAMKRSFDKYWEWFKFAKNL